MSVYVDDMFMKATVPNGARSVTGEWCHMQADTREELDAMADTIGLRRSWIQYPDDDVKRHYDVTRTRRAAAIAAGAVPVGMLDLARMRAKWRADRKERAEMAKAVADPAFARQLQREALDITDAIRKEASSADLERNDG